MTRRMRISNFRRRPGPCAGIVLAAVVLGFLAAAGARAATLSESEGNSRGEPDPLPSPLAPFLSAYTEGFVVVTGAIAPGDTDFFAVDLAAGQLLLVSLFDEKGGELTDTRVGIFRESVGANDPGVGPLAENDDGGPGFLSRIAVPIGATGTWKIGVTGFRDGSYVGAHFEGSGAPVAYRLVIGVTTNTPARVESDPGGSAPGTNDEAPALADTLPAGGALIRGTLGRGDRDQFAVPAAAGQEISVSLFDLATGVLSPANGELNDSRIALFRDGETPPAGTQNDDGGPGFLSNLTKVVPASGGGTWKVALTGFRDGDFAGKHLDGPFDYALVVATTAATAPVPRCDVNGDAFVDSADVNAIFAVRGQPASGPTDPRDSDGDGTITVLDARTCTIQCGNPNCAPRPAAACGLLGIEALAGLVPWFAWRARRRDAALKETR